MQPMRVVTMLTVVMVPLACLTLGGVPASQAKGCGGSGVSTVFCKNNQLVTTPGHTGPPARTSSTKPKYPPCGSNIIEPWLLDRSLNPDDYASYTCVDISGQKRTAWTKTATANGSSAVIDPQVLAYQLLAQMTLDPIDIRTTPLKPQAVGQTPMVFVGLPVWLWADNPDKTTWGPATITAGDLSLTAKVDQVEWDMGDGNRKWCDRPGVAWEKWMDPTKPPGNACTYTYQKTKAGVTIQAISHWVANWSGYGQSGTIKFTTTATKRVDVAEIQVVIK